MVDILKVRSARPFWLHWLLNALRASVIKLRAIIPADNVTKSPAEERYEYESQGAKENEPLAMKTWRW